MLDADAFASNYAAPAPNFNLGGLPFPPASGPTSHFVPGTAGTTGTPGTAAVTSPTTSGTQNAPAPQVAVNNSALENILKDAAGRLEYLFPALFLALVGMLAGRLSPYPARL